MDAKTLGRKSVNVTGPCQGITRRELFAAMVLQGLTANPDPQVAQWDSKQAADCAVKFADALLAELAKDQP